MSNRPNILVVNDDGYEAPGLEALVSVAARHGRVTVITPDSPRSGFSHAITMNAPLRIQQYKTVGDIVYYRTNGTPVDCVKLGQRVVMRDETIDLVLSGINHGSNNSVSIIYSGTMAAAIEASFENLKSIGFSLLDYRYHADFSAAKQIANTIIERVISREIPPCTALNVNIPVLPIEEIKGIKVVRQTKGYWYEDLEEQTDPYGRKYYWITGHLEDTDNGTDTCQWALTNGYVSVQPVQFDMTAHQHISSLKFLEQ